MNLRASQNVGKLSSGAQLHKTHVLSYEDTNVGFRQSVGNLVLLGGGGRE
jgi:hypothetical protein